MKKASFRFCMLTITFLLLSICSISNASPNKKGIEFDQNISPGSSSSVIVSNDDMIPPDTIATGTCYLHAPRKVAGYRMNSLIENLKKSFRRSGLTVLEISMKDVEGETPYTRIKVLLKGRYGDLKKYLNRVPDDEK